MQKIKLGIVGYGNLGRGVECAAMQHADMEVTAIYTRREPERLQTLTPGAEVLPMSALDAQALDAGRPDVLLLCGGSAEDRGRARVTRGIIILWTATTIIARSRSIYAESKKPPSGEASWRRLPSAGIRDCFP